MIVEFLAKKKMEDYLSHIREQDTFYITDLVRCPLKTEFETKYKELAVSEVYTPATMLGDIVHKGLESLIRIENYTTRTEVEGEKIINLEKPFKIKGRSDIILENENEKIIIEIKSARSDNGIPHKHHIMQLQLYLWLFEAKKGILFYITPDRFTEFEINQPMDDATVINLVQQNIQKSPSPRFPWECQYCIFSIICPNKRK